MFHSGNLVKSPSHMIHAYVGWSAKSDYPTPTYCKIDPDSLGILIRHRTNQHKDAYFFVMFGNKFGWVRDTWLAILE